ncbi:MAG: D-methionine transport system ATP-binding protein [Thermosediminibacterales bacterium]|nr:D-methionine transport system ATP-binding protein [Thermosediminibacterales bacterium]
MITIKNLNKVYITPNGGKITALKNINLNIEKGDIFGIVGLSGAGKSTLIRCINRLEEPTTGKVIIDGVDITNLNIRELRNARKKIGMIFQHFNLLNSRNVEDNVAFPLEIVGMPKTEIKKRVSKLLNLVGLEDRAKHYPSELSGGQKQRVGIARALANDPKLLLCDEATSALDPQTTKSILALLKQINKTLGITIILITHEMSVIKEICNRVAVIERGEIIEQGTVFDVFSQPKTLTAKAFLNRSAYELPDDINVNQTANRRLIRIFFPRDSARKPIISRMIRMFEVDVNILAGAIDKIQDQTFGTLTVEITGSKKQVSGAINFLYNENLEVEEVRKSG